MNVRSKFSDVDFLATAPAAGTVISSGSTIDGRITSPSIILVSGLVQGELNASEVVIEKEGSVNGSIFAEHLIICLLYTSPSPRDRTRSRMPSSA